MCQCLHGYLLHRHNNSFAPEGHRLSDTPRYIHPHIGCMDKVPETDATSKLHATFFSQEWPCVFLEKIWGRCLNSCVGRCLGCWRDTFTLHLSVSVCVCCSWTCLLTASEFKRASMGVHREILQLHGALRWYSQSERRSHASKVREQINQLCEVGHHHHHHHYLYKLAYLFNIICFI